jgi:YD repeat-containing protein
MGTRVGHRLAALLAVSALAILAAPGGSVRAGTTGLQGAPSVAPDGVSLPAGVSIVGELLAEDTASSTTYQLSNGEKQVVCYQSPIRYRDVAGKWQTIDPTLAPGSLPGTYHTSSTPFGLAFGSDLSGNAPVTLTSQDFSLGIGMEGLAESSPTTLGSMATYLCNPQTSVRYTATAGGVEQTVILASAVAGNVYTAKVLHPGLQLRQGTEGEWNFYAPGTQKPLFGLSDIAVYDSSKNAEGCPAWCSAATMTVKPGVDTSIVTFTVPRSWLADPARVFPVTIDPTYQDWTSSGNVWNADTYVGSGSPGSSHATATELWCGKNPTPSSGYNRILVRFPDTMMPASSAYVDSVDFSMYRFYSAGSQATLSVSEITNPAIYDWTSGCTWTSLGFTVGNGLRDRFSTGVPSGSFFHANTAGIRHIVMDWRHTQHNYGFLVHQPEDGSQETGFFSKYRPADATGYPSQKPCLTYTTLSSNPGAPSVSNVPSSCQVGQTISATVTTPSLSLPGEVREMELYLNMGSGICPGDLAFFKYTPPSGWSQIATVTDNQGATWYLAYNVTNGSTTYVAPQASGNGVTVGANTVGATFSFQLTSSYSSSAMSAGGDYGMDPVVPVQDHTAVFASPWTNPTANAQVYRPLTVTATADSKTYDGTTTATAHLASTGIQAGDSVTLGYSSATFIDKNMGTAKTVNVSGIALGGPDAGKYSLNNTTATANANITAKNLTISGAAAQNKTYDGATSAIVNFGSASLVGVVSPDVVTISSSAYAASFADKNVGTTKAVSVSGVALSGAGAGNYTLSQPSGLTAAITAKNLTISGAAAQNKTYDGATSAIVNFGSATLVGVVSPDVVTINSSAYGASFADKSAGTAKAVTVSGVTLSGSGAGNYAVSQPSGLTANISAKNLTISGAAAQNKAYDGTTAATVSFASASLVGVVSPDVVAVDSSAYTGSFADAGIGIAKAVTVSGVTLSGSGAGNYTLSQPSGLTAAITARALTATATADSRTYDGTAVATAHLVATGILPGDTVTLSYTSATFADKDVGTARTVNVSGIALGGPDVGKYMLNNTTATASADITAVHLTITGAVAQNKTYDGGISAIVDFSAASLVGVVGPDVVTISSSAYAASFADKNVGTAKAVTVSGVTLSGSGAGNYTLSQPSGLTAAITAKDLTISDAAAANKTYDGTTAVTVSFASATLVGVVNPDVVTINSSDFAANFADKDVDSAKAVTVTGITLSGSGAGNYTVSQPSGLTADITAKHLTISGAAAQNKAYDGTTAATVSFASAGLAGVVSPDVVTIDSSTYTAGFADKNVGTAKAVTVSGVTLSGAGAGNYTLGQPAGLTANIAAENLAISGAVAQNKTYDGTTAATVSFDNATLTGVVSPDVVTINSSAYIAAFADKNVGTAKAVTVSCVTLSGAGAGNYTLSQPAGLTANIAAENLTISGAVAQNKTYDGTASATVDFGSISLVGVVSPDMVTIDSSTYAASFADENVGNAKAVTVSGMSLSGAGAGNYTVSQPSGLTATITAKNLTIAGAVAQNKTYDGTASTTVDFGSASLVGVVSPDVVTIDSSAYIASFADASAGSAKAVTVSGVTLAGAGAGNYTVSQPGGLTADINAPLPTLDITSPNEATSAAVGDELELAWSTDVAPVGGSFAVTAVRADDTEYMLGEVNAEADQCDYGFSWTVAQPALWSYRVRIVYMPAGGGDPVSALSANEVQVTPMEITWLSPAEGSTWAKRTDQTLSWALPAAPPPGTAFDVMVGSSWLTQGGLIPIASGQTQYDLPWTVDLEPDSSVDVSVYLYDENWDCYGEGEATLAVDRTPVGYDFVDAATTDEQTLHLHAGPFLDGPTGGTAWEKLCSSPVTYTWAAHADENASGGSCSAATELWPGQSGAASLDVVDRPQLDVRCYGDSATWVYEKGPDLGIARVYVDGLLWGTVDQYATSSQAQASTAISGLDEAYHEIRIVPAADRNAASGGYGVSHDAFIAKTSPTDATARTLDDSRDPRQFYSWATARDVAAHGGGYTFTDSMSAATAFTFFGGSVTWLYGQGPDLGQARVFIDGVDKGVVDEYAPQTRFHSPSSNRENLIPNPRAHLDANGWDAGTDPTRVTTVAGAPLPTGADAAFAASGGANGLELASQEFDLPEGFGDHPWLDWQFQVHAAGASNVDSFLAARFSWYDSDDQWLGDTEVVNPNHTSSGYETRLPLQGFTRLSGHVSGDEDAVKYRLSVALLPKGETQPEGAELYLTDVQLERGSQSGEVAAYADGDSEGWMWDGAADASASRTLPASDTAVEFDGLSRSQHTIVVESDGTKNDSSSGFRIVSDAFATRNSGGYLNYSEAEVGLPSPGCQISITSPSGAQTLQGEIGSSTTVTWNADDTSQGGAFEVQALAADETSYALGSVAAAPGQHDYELPWTISEPAGEYRIRIVYHPGGAGEAESTTGEEFTLASAGLAVTTPNGGESLPAPGATTNVGWTMACAPTSGAFRVYAVSADDEWDLIGQEAVVPNQVDYPFFAWSIHQTPGTYRVAVAYVDAGGARRVVDESDSSFTIAEPGLGDGPTVSLSAPQAGSTYRLGDTVAASVHVADLEDPAELSTIRLGINRTASQASRYRGIVAWFRDDPNPGDARPGWHQWPIPGTSNYFAIWDSTDGDVDYGSSHITPDWQNSSITFAEDAADVTFAFRLNGDFGNLQHDSLDTFVGMAAGPVSWHYPWQTNAADLMVQPAALASAPSFETDATGWFVETDANQDGVPDNVDDVAGQGRGSVTLSWDAAPAADGYAIYLFDGNAYRKVGSTTETSWSSAGQGIYPSDTQIAGWQDYTGDPFQDGEGLDLRDDPGALYRATSGTSFDTRNDYSFCVVPFNDISGEPVRGESDPLVSVTLDNRTLHACAAPQHTSYALGSFADHDATAQLDQGSLSLAVTDLKIASWGPLAALDRYYDSTRNDPDAGVYAPGWRFGFERSLEQMNSSLVAYLDERGGRYLFHLEGGIWQPPGAMCATLAQNGDEWQLTFKAGDTLTFDADGALLSDADRNGNQVTYERDAETLTITAANGQTIVVTFSEAGKIEHADYTVGSQVRSVDYALSPQALVTYFAGQESVEHAVGYSYSDSRLSAVEAEDWPAANDSVAEHFSYGLDGQLSGIEFADHDAQDPDRADARAEIAYQGRSATVTRYGRIATANDAAPHTPVTEDYSWNATGTMATHTAARIAGEAAAVTAYTYTPADQVAVETAPSGRTTRYRYDEHDNLLEQTDGEGDRTSSAYNASDECTQRTDALGAHTDYVYDEHGNLTDERRDLTDSERACAQYGYDEHGRMTTKRQLISGTPEDGVWAQTDFDTDGYAPCGDPLAIIERGVQLAYGGDPVDLETDRTYDDFGNLLTETEQHEVGAEQPVVSQSNTLDLAGHLSESTNAASVTTHHMYDTLGNQIETWQGAQGTDMKADWHQTSYDAIGRILAETSILSDPEAMPTSHISSVVAHAYDGLGREISSDDTTVGGEPARALYDARGNPTASWSEGGTDYAPEKAERSVYNEEGELLESYAPGAEEPTTYTYWPNGQTKRTTAPDGGWSESAYDAAGNAISQTVAAAGDSQTSISSAYDLGGRLVSLNDEADSSAATYEYDLLDRATVLHQSSDPDASGTVMVLNSVGWTLKAISADSRVATSTYDAAGRPAHTVIDGQVSETTYGPDGQPLVQSDADGETDFTYDPFARLVRKEGPAGGYQLELDSLGRTTSNTDLSTNETTESSYPENEPRSDDDPAETLSGGPEGATTRIYRAPSGLETRRVTQLGEQTSAESTITARDSAGRETGSTLQITGGSMLEAHRTYDAAGRVRQQWGSGFEESAATTDAYTYEPGTSLLQSMDVRLAFGGAITANYDYDSAGRLSEATIGATTTSNSYDSSGRLMSSTTSGPGAETPAARIASGASQVLGIPALTKSRTAANASQMFGVNTVQTTYAYAGNQTKPSSITSGDQTTRYSYDGKQRVSSRTVDHATVDQDITNFEAYSPGNPDITIYTYWHEVGYPGDGKLCQMHDAWHSREQTVQYVPDGHPWSISSSSIWSWNDNYGHQLLWSGNQLAEVMGDPANCGLEEYLYYHYDMFGRADSAHLQGRNDGEPVDLYYKIVTLDPGKNQGGRIGALTVPGVADVRELLDVDNHAFATYSYDIQGNVTIHTQPTSAIDADLASKIAQNQVLRFHSLYYSSQLNLYWNGDIGNWYDPALGHAIGSDAWTGGGSVWTSLSAWLDSLVGIDAWYKAHPSADFAVQFFGNVALDILSAGEAWFLRAGRQLPGEGSGSLVLPRHLPDITADAAQLEAKFKHAADFGVMEGRGAAGFQRFGDAIRSFVEDTSTVRTVGEYRRAPAILNYNAATRLVVVQAPDGAFITGWRMSVAQLKNVIERRSLGGG